MKLELRGIIIEDLAPQEVEDLRRQLGGKAVTASNGLLTTREAAQRLNCSEDFIRDHAKELGGERIAGGPWRFPPDLSLHGETSGRTEDAAKPRRRRRTFASGSSLEVRGEAP